MMPEITVSASNTQIFEVHTTGGKELTIKADTYEIKEENNRIYFYDAKGQEVKDWIIFLSGVAAIHPRRPRELNMA
jgi:uncharacterized protein YcfL